MAWLERRVFLPIEHRTGGPVTLQRSSKALARARLAELALIPGSGERLKSEPDEEASGAMSGS